MENNEDFDVDIEDEVIEADAILEKEKADKDKADADADALDKEEASEKRIKALEDEIKADKDSKEFNAEISELESKHEGFSKDKVHEYLKELHKSNPEKADKLNNSVGWENIWITELQPKEVENDNPNMGRNVNPVERASEVLDSVAGGGVTLADEQDVLRNLL